MISWPLAVLAITTFALFAFLPLFLAQPKPQPKHAMLTTTTIEEKVPFYVSKTVIVNAIIAICAFWPPAREWVSANPATTLTIVSSLGVALRVLTRGKLVLQ